jgi:hypothetical protein
MKLSVRLHGKQTARKKQILEETKTTTKQP